MLFDIGWPELLLIGVVALVVIGPKDLPRALRTAGFWVRKARTLSREFQSSIDQMIREAELDEVRQELKKATEFDLEKEIKQTVDPTGELAQSIKPPELPDYFVEAEGPDPAPAVAERQLSAPAETAETAAPEPAASAEGTPEPANSAEDTPPGAAEHSIGAPAAGPEHEAAPAPAPKP
ncbi:MAG TPA: Sec-independent protein translocase protein TatB [Stellaceae bacterium]